MVDSEKVDNHLYGEELDAYMQKMRAKSDAFFAAAGKKDLEVYRIMQFEPVPQLKEHFGEFFVGDSYVVVKN
jgi:hypothetical protein